LSSIADWTADNREKPDCPIPALKTQAKQHRHTDNDLKNKIKRSSESSITGNVERSHSDSSTYSLQLANSCKWGVGATSVDWSGRGNYGHS
jgi:hypothetical protein